MTSANLSLTRNQVQQDQPGSKIPAGKNARGPFAWHKGVFGRRIWTIGLTILYLFVYYVIGTAMIISRSNYRAELYRYTLEQTLSQRLYEVSKWIGIRQNFWAIPMLIGVLLGIEGYSYLFNMVKMDFYESQPMPRGQRFRRIYINGVLIFIVPYVITYAIGILIAFVMGGMNGLLLTETLIAFVRVLIGFLAGYSVGILAAMLSGNGVIAGCVASVILFSEYVYQYTLGYCMQTFYKTYYNYYSSYMGNSQFGRISWFYLSPMLRMDVAHDKICAIDNYEYVPFTQVTLGKALSSALSYDIGMAAIAIVVLAAAFILFMRRRAEAAGNTVIYGIARFVLKMIVAIGGALFLGISVIYSIAQEVTGDENVMTAITIVGMLCVVVLICGVMQGIYEMNARRFLGRLWQTGVAAIAVAAIFALFRYDLTGYDSYLPEISDVAYASITMYDNTSYLFEDPENPGESMAALDYREKYMTLTDIYTVEQLAQIGQAAMVQNSNASIDGWGCGLVYTLRNGKTVARSLLIPYDIDEDLMNRIVGSDEFKEGFFSVYQGENGIIASTKDKAVLAYTNGQDQLNGSGTLYAAFCEAYQKDLAQYDYSYATSHYPVGYVRYYYDGSDESFSGLYEVYEDYTNTIAFLKENNLYVEAMEVAGTVTQVEITRWAEDGARDAVYTDPEQIKEILRASVLVGYDTAWKKSSDYTGGYSIETNTDTQQYDSYYSNRDFKAGEVPQFVIDDLGQDLADETNIGVDVSEVPATTDAPRAR